MDTFRVFQACPAPLFCDQYNSIWAPSEVPYIERQTDLLGNIYGLELSFCIKIAQLYRFLRIIPTTITQMAHCFLDRNYRHVLYSCSRTGHRLICELEHAEALPCKRLGLSRRPEVFQIRPTNFTHGNQSKSFSANSP